MEGRKITQVEHKKKNVKPKFYQYQSSYNSVLAYLPPVFSVCWSLTIFSLLLPSCFIRKRCIAWHVGWLEQKYCKSSLAIILLSPPSLFLFLLFTIPSSSLCFLNKYIRCINSFFFAACCYCCLANLIIKLRV